MRKIFNIIGLLLVTTFTFSSCIKETFPESDYVVASQAKGNLALFVNGIRVRFNQIQIVGTAHWDFGYPALMIQRDLLGQDMVFKNERNSISYGQFNTWYTIATGLGPDYTASQFPWRWYYRMIGSCNSVIPMVDVNDPNLTTQDKWSLGAAYFFRAFGYFDLARLYIDGAYLDPATGVKQETALTVPIVTNETEFETIKHNPRATAHDMYEFILEDIDTAIGLLAGSTPSNCGAYMPCLAVAQGLKARVCLEIGEWADAKQLAADAAAPYTLTTQAQYIDRTTGFNTPTAAWMLATGLLSEDDAVQSGIINWTSFMSCETDFGYSYPGGGDHMFMDAHLWHLMGASDWRRQLFQAPGATVANQPTNFPGGLPQYITSGAVNGDYISFKFRPSNGEYFDFTVGAAASVPLMRVEEMKLIEAEAAGRLNLSDGVNLLTTFVKTRDAAYAFSPIGVEHFIEEVWNQRRIELWGEGFGLFDLKRLNKPVTRSYDGPGYTTNHRAGFRWNTDGLGSTGSPMWLNYCIVRTEFNNNDAIDPALNNPVPLKPTADSDPVHYAN